MKPYFQKVFLGLSIVFLGGGVASALNSPENLLFQGLRMGYFEPERLRTNALKRDVTVSIWT